MANADQHPQAPPSGAPHVNPVHQSPQLSFWIRELPFSLVLILTIGGVAYTSFSKHPILIYWGIYTDLRPCLRLVWMAKRRQLQSTAADSYAVTALDRVPACDEHGVLGKRAEGFERHFDGFAVFTLLALGTFTAGVHILSWQVCLLGLIMAFGIPAIAWIENSALLLVLVLAAIVGIGVVIWWHWHERRGRTV